MQLLTSKASFGKYFLIKATAEMILEKPGARVTIFNKTGFTLPF